MANLSVARVSSEASRNAGCSTAQAVASADAAVVVARAISLLKTTWMT